MLKPLVIATAITMAFASQTTAAASSVRYQVTDLGVGTAQVEHINNAGNVLANVETPLSEGSSQYYSRPSFWNGSTWLQMPEISGRTGNTWTYSGEGMNDSGMVVGASKLTASEFDDSIVGQYQGFVWNTNTNQVTAFGAPSYGNESTANAINNQGLVAGAMGTSGSAGTYRAMVWNNGAFSDAINPANPANTIAEEINSQGYIAGQYFDAQGSSVFYKNHVLGSTIYQYSNASYSELDVEDLNDQGLVVLSAENDCDQNCRDSKGIVWDATNNTIVEIESTPGWAWGSSASGLNNLGQVVGQGKNSHDVGWDGAIIWDATNGIQSINQLLEPGTEYHIWEGIDINDNGVILATGAHMDDGMTGRLLLLTPVPEPETYALMLAGLWLVGFAARRRKSA